jgi:NAD+ synthase (glutamine-hydrolysing)
MSVVVGTTNRSEGAYIGFFGKASDGMVDIQPIYDIHKSEVYQVAKLLGVPQNIIDATPSGDVFDGRVDEQMIGASYDFLELYQLILSNPNKYSILDCIMSNNAKEEFDMYAKVIETLHTKNNHKKTSPAIFLDVLDRHVPGGLL